MSTQNINGGNALVTVARNSQEIKQDVHALRAMADTNADRMEEAAKSMRSSAEACLKAQEASRLTVEAARTIVNMGNAVMVTMKEVAEILEKMQDRLDAATAAPASAEKAPAGPRIAPLNQSPMLTVKESETVSMHALTFRYKNKLSVGNMAKMMQLPGTTLSAKLRCEKCWRVDEVARLREIGCEVPPLDGEVLA